MSHLPWCTPPINNLGVCGILKDVFPGREFDIGDVPISCLPEKISIYQTGNSPNPNTIPIYYAG